MRCTKPPLNSGGNPPLIFVNKIIRGGINLNTKKWIGPLFLSLSAAIWGGMFVVVKIAVRYIPPLQLVWLRYLIAIIVLLLFSLLKKEKWSINLSDIRLILLIGFIGNAVSIVAQETGTWLSNAQSGAVITSSTPTFMLLFAWWLLKEKLTRTDVISIIMATIGVVCIVGVHFEGKNVLLGILLLTLAALSWALMSILIKKLSSTYSSLQITIMSISVALIVLSPFVIYDQQIISNIDFLNPSVFFCLGYLGVISTSLAFVMWNRGLQLVSAGHSGLYFLIQPIVGTILGWLFLKEPLSLGFLVGGFLIGTSVWLNIRQTRKTKGAIK